MEKNIGAFMKKLLLSTATIVVLSTSVFATGNAALTSTARLDALGLNNSQTDDFANIFANPALLVNYSNTAYMESLEQNTTGFGGASYGLLGGVVAVFLNRPASRVGSNESTLFNQTIDTGFIVNDDIVNTGQFSDTNGLIGIVGNVGINDNGILPENSLDILYAISLGSDLDVGIRTSFASVERSSTTLETSVAGTQKASELGVELGVNIKDMNLDLSVAYSLLEAESSLDQNKSFSDNGAFSFAVNARHKRSLGKNTSLRTVVSYAVDSFNFQSVEATLTENRDDTTTNLSGSVTIEHKVSNSTTGYALVGVKFVTYEDEFNDGAANATVDQDIIAMTLIPLVVGVESKTSDTWSFRGSISSYLYGAATQRLSSQTGTAAATGTQTDLSGATTTVNLSVGTTYLVGGFKLDGVIQSGVPLFGGNNVLDSVLGKLGVSYQF
jgi:hypothetical protein